MAQFLGKKYRLVYGRWSWTTTRAGSSRRAPGRLRILREHDAGGRPHVAEPVAPVPDVIRVKSKRRGPTTLGQSLKQSLRQ